MAAIFVRRTATPRAPGSGKKGRLNGENFSVTSNAGKIFFYDCLDDAKSANETEAQFQQRLAAQVAEFQKIRSTFGTHVRLGKLAGTGKGKRQKEVDILLAVEAMNHAVRQNMKWVHLLSGDGDFRPLVEALVQMGLFVEVSGDRRTTSQDLVNAADYFRPLELSTYLSFSIQRQRQQFPIPQISGGAHGEGTQLKAGTVGGVPAELCQTSNGFMVLYKRTENPLNINFPDQVRLELFCKLEFGDVAWV